MVRALPLVFVLLAASIAAAESSDVKIKAWLDYSDKEPAAKRGRWHPVHITLENRSAEDLDGKVWIEVEVGNGQVLDLRTTRTLSLAKGARKRFTMEVRLEGSESAVYVGADFGGPQKLVGLPIIWIDDDTDSILVVGNWASAHLKRIERKNPGPDGEEWFPQRRPFLVDPADLPDAWRGLDGVETFVWDGRELRDLSEAQVQAIEDWVTMGGNLVLAGGDACASYYASPLASLLPGRCGGRVEVDVGKELAAKIGLPPPLKSKTLLAARIEGAEAPVGVFTKWAAAEGAPLLIEKSVGLGRICVVPFDLASEQAMGAKGIDLLLNALVGWRSFSVARQQLTSDAWWGQVGYQPFLQRLRAFGQGSTYYDQTARLKQVVPALPLDAALPESFSFAAGLRVPPSGKIATFLLVYVLACLANLLVWRAARRREFAWSTLLALSLGFAGYAWRDAVLNAQWTPSVSHITVVELGPDGRGRETSWFGLWTTVSQRVEVGALSPRDGLALMTWDRTARIGESETELIEDGGAPRIPELAMLPRSVACVRTEGVAREEVSVQVKTERHDGEIRVSVLPPPIGDPLVPVLLFADAAFPMSLGRPDGGFERSLPLDRALIMAGAACNLESHLQAAALTHEAAGAISVAVGQGSRNGDRSFVLVPIARSAATVRYAAHEAQADGGLTLLVVPIRWDGCLEGVPDLARFCGSSVFERTTGNVAWELTPGWDGPPDLGVVDPPGAHWDWRELHWVAAPHHSSSLCNPFSHAVRCKLPFDRHAWDYEEVDPRPPVIHPR